MLCSKAPGPSRITAEMLGAAGEDGVEIIRQLTETVFCSGEIPELIFVMNLYKGHGDALDRGNYRGLKLTD